MWNIVRENEPVQLNRGDNCWLAALNSSQPVRNIKPTFSRSSVHFLRDPNQYHPARNSALTYRQHPSASTRPPQHSTHTSSTYVLLPLHGDQQRSHWGLPALGPLAKHNSNTTITEPTRPPTRSLATLPVTPVRSPAPPSIPLTGP